MKKFISLMLALTMVFTLAMLAGCGSKQEEAPAAEPQAEENAEEEETPAEEEAPAVDERDQRIADLEAEIARLEEENGALKERIAELEGEPAAKSAAEEFKNTEEKNSKVAKMEKRGYRF